MGATRMILVLASLAMAHIIWAFYLEDNRSVPLSSAFSRAIGLYNTQPGNKWAYKLLHIIPSSSRPRSTNPQIVRFTIKETSCARSVRRRLRKCPFKDGGLVKICSIAVSEDQDIVTVPVCQDVPEQRPSFASSEEESGSGEIIQDAKSRCRRPGSCTLIGRFNQRINRNQV
ncbi:hypothetical protein XENTR_v10015793 [Xenopus tropicalis]|uniref:Cathelicidin antimicrobial peptide n=1 Tax=Xenopus tropicalis TaxID=8364 RepID=A0A8J0R550_XENTR|nr:cathelicidin antimicrobial peptide [Xenopus tropicalis]KAE8595543.1 hypothetical protein XENTR_v10015793 [Xenopus tropicalis]|eukprot:XP_004915567.1 PREDICTED: cathelicidin antimicrobial peptide [Xenopus tropicalis]